MKITLEFVGWLDERLYSRAVCGLLEKRAICPPLEAERNFEAKRKGEREGEREREGGSQSIELLDAGFHVCFTCYEFRVQFLFFFFLQFIFISDWFSIENFESKFLSDWSR